jgi:hypothetical protein
VDKYDRYVLANDADKQRTLDLIAIFCKWKNTPEHEKEYEDTRPPFDRCDDYFEFGWPSELAPNFDDIGNAHNNAKLNLTSSSKPSVSASEIRRNFSIIKSKDANDQLKGAPKQQRQDALAVELDEILNKTDRRTPINKSLAAASPHIFSFFRG